MPELGTDYSRIGACRSCGTGDLRTVLDFGPMPLSDALVEPGADRDQERHYPLTFVFCPACSLVQIMETVDPERLFGEDYPYYSSFSQALVEHARALTSQILDQIPLGDHSLVVEIASNDGYLLQWFQKAGIPVLGIDPASGPAGIARERGIPTMCEFFDLSLARRLVKEGKRADVIVGNNVLAHVPDQNEFVEAIKALLADDGTVVMEFPYVRDLIEKTEFDTIYHEHHCYFSVSSVSLLFERHGLELVSVQRIPIHGGSLRAFFRAADDPDHSVADLLLEEKETGLGDLSYYQEFSGRVQELRSNLLLLLETLKGERASIAAYGAAAKGAVLLNYCGIDDRYLDYVVDRNTHKHGLEMPGVPLPIHAPQMLMAVPVDYLLILAWNFQAEIMAQQTAFSSRGGRFIVPIPTPKIV